MGCDPLGWLLTADWPPFDPPFPMAIRLVAWGVGGQRRPGPVSVRFEDRPGAAQVWLRLDLNQRPLSYGGNGGCDGRQTLPTGPIGNWRL